MKLRRLRLSLLQAMICVMIAALALGIFERTWRIVRLQRAVADYRREVDRLEWCRTMLEKGYVSRASVESQKIALHAARAALEQAE